MSKWLLIDEILHNLLIIFSLRHFLPEKLILVEPNEINETWFNEIWFNETWFNERKEMRKLNWISSQSLYWRRKLYCELKVNKSDYNYEDYNYKML